MRRRVSDDMVGAIFFGLVGVVFIVGAVQIPADVSAASVVGPRVFPMLVGIMLVLFSVLLIIQVARRSVTGPVHEAAPREGGPPPAESVPASAAASSTAAAEEHHFADDLVGHPIESAAWNEAHAVAEADRAAPRRIVVILALLAVYIFTFIPLGYPLSTFVFLAAITTYLDRARLIRNLVYAALFSAVVFVVFNYGLGVQLPLGVLG